jgi:hypothetical protein
MAPNERDHRVAHDSSPLGIRHLEVFEAIILPVDNRLAKSASFVSDLRGIRRTRQLQDHEQQRKGDETGR